MNTILRVENVGKQYQLGPRQAYATVRESLLNAGRGVLQRLRGSVPAEEYLWALDDVSFEVPAGQVLGIIGANGAGKSTLLKILSRITAPTTGRIELYGRAGSLLDIGTGFHSELTGRENIYLNGVVLGMRSAEIRRRFDEIVAFAELDRFIDTPLKHYSTGMYVRLAFAVAAHLEPEILLVDEVLAFGDAAFQKKCLGKMESVAQEGRTVIFVSHQLASLKLLCTRVIEMRGGKIVQDGVPAEVMRRYLADTTSNLSPQRAWPRDAAPGNDEFRLLALRTFGPDGKASAVYRSGDPITVEFEFELGTTHSTLCIGFDLLNQEGTIVFRSFHNDRGEQDWPPLRLGHNKLRCTIPPGLLNWGTYYVAPKAECHLVDWILDGDPVVSFDVQLDHSDSPYWSWVFAAKFPGVIAPCLTWKASADPD